MTIGQTPGVIQALRIVAKAAKATQTKEDVDAAPKEETATEEIAAAPAEPRRETRQRKSEAIVNSTSEQPTQGLAQGPDGVRSNGFVAYPIPGCLTGPSFNTGTIPRSV